jgi:hypothetical protein
MLAWYGLEFAESENPREDWKLQVAPNATADQKANLQALFATYPK